MNPLAPAAATGNADGSDTIVRFRAGDGGALFIFSPPTLNSTCDVRDTAFAGNGCQCGAGGAASVWGNVTLSVSASAVYGCSAAGGGGAFALGSGAVMNLDDSALTAVTAGIVSRAGNATAPGGQPAPAPYAGNPPAANVHTLRLRAGTPTASTNPSSPAPSENGDPHAAGTAAVGGGAAVEVSPDVTDPQPSCATGTPSGGSVWVAAGASAALTDSAVSVSAAVANGGAFAVSAGGALAVRNVSVTGSLANKDGGVARVDSGGTISVQESTWTLNRARFGGSLISIGPGANVSMAGITATSARTRPAPRRKRRQRQPQRLIRYSCCFSLASRSSLPSADNTASSGARFYFDQAAPLPTCDNCLFAFNQATNYVRKHRSSTTRLLRPPSPVAPPQS